MQETISWRGLSCTLYYELDSVTGRKVLESWTIDSVDDRSEVFDQMGSPIVDHATDDMLARTARELWSHLDPLRD